ncbi:hypothetical protein LRAMOSA03458 [Lichtheimia ramosa]|uniref:Uncharacterized protein n=1 Tax=Lichtheimia ramosa TaxID=688394 RepID=A0A077WV48_9FUNG|nr:hypothetical protein LRAMOSA03458 [Lichtheimia ramosa]
MQRSNSTISCWPSAKATRDQVLLSWFKTPGNMYRYCNAPTRGRLCSNPDQLSRSNIIGEVHELLAKEGLKYQRQSVTYMLTSWMRKYDIAKALQDAKPDNPKAVKSIFPYFYEIQPFEDTKPTCADENSQSTTPAMFTRQHSTTTTTIETVSGPISASYWHRSASFQIGATDSHQVQSPTILVNPSSVTQQQEPTPLFDKQHEPSNRDNDGGTLSGENSTNVSGSTAVTNDIPPGFADLIHQSNESMRRTIDVLLQQQQLFVGFIRSQDMEKQALLIRAMHDAGFSKDDVLSVLRGYDERYQSQQYL